MNLAELETLAKAASRGKGQSRYTSPRDCNNWQANQAFTESFDADTALALLAVVRAAKAFQDAADKEGLLMGAGRNHSTEKEGPRAKALRSALLEMTKGLKE